MNRFLKSSCLIVLASIGQVALAQSFLYNGRAAAGEAFRPDGSTYFVAVAGPVARRTGGEDWASVQNLNIENLVFADTVTAYTKGADLKVVAQSKISNLRVANPNPFEPDIIQAGSIVSRSFDTSTTTAVGSSTFENLVIYGTPVTVGKNPNQSITLNVPGVGKVFVRLNVQVYSKNGAINTVAARVIFPTGDILNIGHTTAGMIPN